MQIERRRRAHAAREPGREERREVVAGQMEPERGAAARAPPQPPRLVGRDLDHLGALRQPPSGARRHNRADKQASARGRPSPRRRRRCIAAGRPRRIYALGQESHRIRARAADECATRPRTTRRRRRRGRRRGRRGRGSARARRGAARRARSARPPSLLIGVQPARAIRSSAKSRQLLPSGRAPPRRRSSATSSSSSVRTVDSAVRRRSRLLPLRWWRRRPRRAAPLPRWSAAAYSASASSRRARHVGVARAVDRERAVRKRKPERRRGAGRRGARRGCA